MIALLWPVSEICSEHGKVEMPPTEVRKSIVAGFLQQLPQGRGRPCKLIVEKILHYVNGEVSPVLEGWEYGIEDQKDDFPDGDYQVTHGSDQQKVLFVRRDGRYKQK
jgi:hypothetical protein